MAKRNVVEEKVYVALEKPIEEMGFELMDVIYRKEEGKLFLRLLVDKVGGINIEECVLINEKFDKYIEEDLALTNHDYFEVSSPGLDRPLHTAKDFRVYKGELVDVKLYKKRDDKKLFTGKIVSADENQLVIEEENTEENISFDFKDLAKVSRTIRF